MNRSRAVHALALLVALLAAAAAGAGILWPETTGPQTFTNVHGADVELYGRGLYRHDSLLIGAGSRGTDAVALALGLPLLLLALGWSRRGSPRGTLLLTGMLGYFLYVAASYALGVALNELFLVYVAMLGASLFAFALALRQAAPLAARLGDRPPRRGIAAFLVVAGLVTAGLWLEAPLRALAGGGPPALLGGYTTLVTHVLDLAVIVPACLLSAALLLRRDPRGYVLAFPLLALIVMLLPTIVAQTASQLSAGVVFMPAEVAGPIGGFLLLGTIAAWLAARLLRAVGAAEAAEGAPRPPAVARREGARQPV